MSKFFKLNGIDFLKGMLVATGTAVLTSLTAILNSGRLPNKQELIAIGISSLAALSAYLIKNLFTNSNGEIGKVE